jgi:hypothetical protein
MRPAPDDVAMGDTTGSTTDSTGYLERLGELLLAWLPGPVPPVASLLAAASVALLFGAACLVTWGRLPFPFHPWRPLLFLWPRDREDDANIRWWARPVLVVAVVVYAAAAGAGLAGV